MNVTPTELLALWEKGDYALCEEKALLFIDQTQNDFMEELTVNTATDYVAAVLFYGNLAKGEKKPWKVLPALKTATGALRFLEDYMGEKDVLAQTLASVAVCYEGCASYQEAALYYEKAAFFALDKESSQEAYANAFYYLYLMKQKPKKELLVVAEEKIGKESLSRLLKTAQEEASAQVEIDPVEWSEAYGNVRFETEKRVGAYLEENPESTQPFALRYWEQKKKVLKEDFDIDWKTPAEMNPHIRFY